MIMWINWNPPKEIFILPIIGFPILWYSLFFASGFFLGIYVFYKNVQRYLLNYYEFVSQDIVSYEILENVLKNPETEDQKKISKIIFEKFSKITKENILKVLNSLFDNSHLLNYINPLDDKEFENSKKSAIRLYLEKTYLKMLMPIQKKASLITDKLIVFVVIATILGARLGHILFYEDILFYFKNPSEIFGLKNGGIQGLASHGAAIFIFIALYLVSFPIKKISKRVSFLTILDLTCLSTALAGGFIRMGNFFNQEILGKATNSFFGIIFQNPIDGSIPCPRHPVQLYEACFYFLTFFILYRLGKSIKILKTKGKISALFFILIFASRFFFEFFKEKQSMIIQDSSSFLMGQYLSIPFILLGFVMLYRDFLKKIIIRRN